MERVTGGENGLAAATEAPVAYGPGITPLRKNISTKTVSGDIGMRPHALLTFITVTHL